jgi:hypothetical protein
MQQQSDIYFDTTTQIINVSFELFLIGFPSGYRDQFGL